MNFLLISRSIQTVFFQCDKISQNKRKMHFYGPLLQALRKRVLSSTFTSCVFVCQYIMPLSQCFFLCSGLGLSQRSIKIWSRISTNICITLAQRGFCLHLCAQWNSELLCSSLFNLNVLRLQLCSSVLNFSSIYA